MKNIIVTLILIFSHHYVLASLVETASDLDGSSGKLKNSVFGLFQSNEDAFLEQAKQARAAVCKRDVTYKSLSAQNVWNEIQAVSKIQQATTLKFIQTCSQMTTGNKDFCEKMQPNGTSKPELLRLYEEIQGCAHQRVEERAPVLAQKLGKNKILSCINSAAPQGASSLLGSEVYFVNTNYTALTFDEVKRLDDLNPTLCKVDGKFVDLKIMLEGSAFAKCIAPQPIFVACIKQRCPEKVDRYCIDRFKGACLAQLQDKDEFLVMDINKCYMSEVRNPTDSQTLQARQQCHASKNLNRLDASLMRVGSGIGSPCDRKLKNCIAAVSNAFSLREETLCNSSPNNSRGNAGSAGSK